MCTSIAIEIEFKASRKVSGILGPNLFIQNRYITLASLFSFRTFLNSMSFFFGIFFFFRCPPFILCLFASLFYIFFSSFLKRNWMNPKSLISLSHLVAIYSAYLFGRLFFVESEAEHFEKFRHRNRVIFGNMHIKSHFHVRENIV